MYPAFVSSSSPFFGHKEVSVYRKSLNHSFGATHRHCQLHRCQLSSESNSDVVIIGAGIAGLSTAFEVARRGGRVRVITSPSRRPAGLAAAGMLAPHSESISGPVFDLCRASLALYPNFVYALNQIVPEIDIRFRSCNNFLLPALDGTQIPSTSPNAHTQLLNADQLRTLEPALGPRVTSAVRCLDDASVDNRQLMLALRTACQKLGVRIDEVPIRRIITSSIDSQVHAVQTEDGTLIQGAHYVLANGAWMRNLLPSIPIRPVKGQMLSLVPSSGIATSDCLEHVLYGNDVYIVPKEDATLYHVGGTVEDIGFSTTNTAGGISKLLASAIALVPAFADYEIQETWAGLRPTTPDLDPILGASEYRNLSIAGGLYRNGVLLAPIIAQLISSLVFSDSSSLSSQMHSFLNDFSASRFVNANASATDYKTPASSTMKRKDKHAPNQRSGLSQTANSNMAHAPEKQTTGAQEVKMFKILKDGTRQPIYPFPEWNRQSSDKSAASATSENADTNLNRKRAEEGEPAPAPTAATSSGTENKSKVLMYRILKDGTREPVYPPPDWEPSPAPKQPSGGSEADAPSPQMLYSASVKDPESVSGINDAYDDVLINQEREDREDHEKLARAHNRSFGRTRSYLEDIEGTPVLSLSQEDVIRFDKALEEGIQDMKGFAKRFSPEDPSVLATKEDMEIISRDAYRASIEADSYNSNINGARVLIEGDNSDSENTGLSTDGYY